MNARWPRAIRVGLLALAGAIGPTLPAGDLRAEPTIEAVRQAWQARQDETRTARFAWKQIDFIPAGMMVSPPQPGQESPLSGPPQDLSLELDYELSLDGGKLRLSARGPQWISDRGEFHPKWFLSVTDGAVSKNFFEGDLTGQRMFHPTGFINQGAQHSQANDIQLLPLLLVYRPFDVVVSTKVDLDAFEVEGDRGIIGDRSCVIVSRKSAEYGVVQVWAYWLDEQRAYLPLRVTSHSAGALSSQVDIAYGPAEDASPRPRRWKVTAYASNIDPSKPGSIMRQFSVAEASGELNVPIPAADFQFEFPVDTEVVDFNTDSWYIVRPGGEKRLVTDRELTAGVPYEELLTTESGMARPEPASRLPLILGAAVIVVGFAIAASILRKRISRRSV